MQLNLLCACVSVRLSASMRVCVRTLVRVRAGEREREDYLKGRVANPHSRGDTDTERLKVR